MAKFALPIKSTYVPDWGVWECLREFVQNAKDEEDDRGSEMKISHSGDVLSVYNRGADMDRSVLLLGKTSKADRSDLRGQFGEGLNLALLAGIRAGLDIVIYTQHERWTATLEPSDDYAGEECLVVHSRKLPKRRDGVEVQITGLDADSWEETRQLFLFLADIPDHKIVHCDYRGSLLLDKRYAGMVFAKGVFVSKLKDFQYGYDLKDLELDRDRRMVDVWNVQYAAGALFKDAVAKRPEALKADVYRMLRDGAEDTRGMHYHVRDGNVLAALTQEFVEEHGEDAVPVANTHESAKVDRAGKRGIVVPESLRKILQVEMGTPDEVVQKGLRDIVETHAWADLSEDERTTLSLAAMALDAVLEGRDEVLTRTEVVSFRDDNLQGTCDMESGSIRIARGQLSSVPAALRVLVHEEAHSITRAGDGDPRHTSAIEELWMKLWAVREGF